jgi:leucyl-tRNA synthetase
MEISQNTYEPAAIEPKWQSAWKTDCVDKAPQPQPGQETSYILDMFPYPSGSGIHVGHLLGYVGTDVLARFHRMQGKAVLHPMGWDAFGLPAENYAIKTNVHPAITTVENTTAFKKQIGAVSLSYDWTKEFATTDPEYYRWTQWLFGLLYKKGLAYRKEGLVNWCEHDKTVLANEQVVGGMCERCGNPVIQRNLRQWYFKITDYAERLLADLDDLDWPEKIKAMQRNWIGKSQGVTLDFPLVSSLSGSVALDSDAAITVFTTRPDTLFGVTYLVLAPEHPLVAQITSTDQRDAVQQYIHEAARKSELERSMQDKEKTGVFTGAYAKHPITDQAIPIWIADYVLQGYGTGAIMAVPAHDERDAAFAAVYALPITEAVTEDGRIIIPEGYDFTGTPAEITAAMVKKVDGNYTTTYRLRDWLVSRQRFWGTPIPIAYDNDGNEYLIPESELPVTLPTDIDFKPNGQSPLVDATDWRTYTASNGDHLIREADTLDGFVCSSWYFLRFPNPDYAEGMFDPEAVKQWLPVSVYVGGAEHAVLHLLYARFITKVLFDEGMIDFTEPFHSLRNQGMILGPDHQKMSKSKGNVINPDTVIAEYGADSLRMFELFMGPFDQEKPWNTQGIVGVRRFLDKFWQIVTNAGTGASPLPALQIIHRSLAVITEQTEHFKYNGAVARFMEMTNALIELQQPIGKEAARMITRMITPYAPHIAAELWQHLGETDHVVLAEWPTCIDEYLIESEVIYAVQVNGKLRATFSAAPDASEESCKHLALEIPAVQQFTQGEIVKTIFVPGKLISFVVR